MLKIAIIDDDKVYRVLAAKMIEATGIPAEIQLIDDAEDGLAEFRGADFPNMIFLDLNMPAMDGWEFLKEISVSDAYQGLREKCKIFVMSSSDNASDKERSSRFPFLAGYLVKPLDKSDYLKLFLELDKESL